MFQNKKYITSGVNVYIPIITQVYLWQLIDARIKTGAKMDYLQIFRLSAKKDSTGFFFQEISHEQERPPFKSKHELQVDECLNIKIYVIDSGEYSTMLLASEY
jgi:hypothetical protein